MFTVGIIKPSTRPGKAEELAAILPEGIAMEHAQLNVSAGTREQLEQAISDYDEKIAAMAAGAVDLVHAAGVPPLILGYRGEQELVRGWERRYGRPVFTNGMSQVNALRAFGAKRVIGASYFPGRINRTFGAYFSEAGFEVLGMEGMDVAFDRVIELDPEAIRAFVRSLFHRQHDVDAICLLGSAWPTLQMIESLESEFAVPVVHHIACQCWEIQKRFALRRPAQGCGRLMREMP